MAKPAQRKNRIIRQRRRRTSALSTTSSPLPCPLSQRRCPTRVYEEPPVLCTTLARRRNWTRHAVPGFLVLRTHLLMRGTLQCNPPRRRSSLTSHFFTGCRILTETRVPGAMRCIVVPECLPSSLDDGPARYASAEVVMGVGWGRWGRGWLRRPCQSASSLFLLPPTWPDDGWTDATTAFFEL